MIGFDYLYDSNDYGYECDDLDFDDDDDYGDGNDDDDDDDNYYDIVVDF